MYCRCISLLFAAATLGGCGGPGLPEPESGPDADTALPATSRIQPQEAQLVREDFPFPVMPGWVERNGLHVDSLTRQALSSTWIHESDPAVQATAYRRMLERAGYRTGPGLLSGDVEMAFTGTGAIAGEPFHFGVGFLRGNHGDQRVALLFIPGDPPCQPEDPTGPAAVDPDVAVGTFAGLCPDQSPSGGAVPTFQRNGA